MRKKINCALLVDDDIISNFISEKCFKNLNISKEVKIVTNGELALKYIEECGGEDSPCPELILLDINMPVMDAFRFLDIYKTKFSSATGKIVILSTSNHPDDIEKLFQFGITDYINKPLSMAKITQIMEKHFDWKD
jgi:CheY-like chemotaxis protein